VRAAAVTAAGTGTLRTDFTASATDTVYSMALSKQGDTLYLAGAFTSINGDTSANAAAAVDPVSGALRPFPAGSVIPPKTDACVSQMKSVTTDQTSVYFGAEGTGGGCFDGTFAANVSDGSLKWVSRCLGATQGAEVVNGVLYIGSHAHDCEQDAGFDPDAFPEVGWARGLGRHLMARDAATGTLTAWNPNTDGGPNNQGLGPRVMATDGTQLFVGGEFSSVNSVGQQGFARFSPATGDQTAPARPARPVAVARPGGKVSVFVQAPFDIDDSDVTVRLYRDGGSTPIATKQAHSLFWKQPILGFEDNGLATGTTHTYTADAVEDNGSNVSQRSTASAAVTVATTLPAYATAVSNDDPSLHWRLAQPAGPVAADSSASLSGGIYNGGVTFNQAGAVGDGNTAVTTNGSTGFVSSSAKFPTPSAFSVETWIKTTSTSGGKIIGFGNRQAGLDFSANPALSGNYDKHVYMTNDGRLVFGVWVGFASTISSSTAYNDGQWHHVVGTQGPTGMALYVDGARIGTNGTTTSQPYDGFWRVGGDNLNGWPAQPSSPFFAGTIDDVAVYPAALSKTQVTAHYAASGRTPPAEVKPADTYGRTVYDDGPASYWRLDETTGSTAADASNNSGTGDYVGGVTKGVPGALPTGTAATLDGSTGNVVSTTGGGGPSAFSAELWFNTTTTTGGKLVGFGNAHDGSSGAYDKHVYMRNDGRLIFGVWVGFPATITSPTAYNDGQWHHLVASQGPSGLVLYVDGLAVGTEPTATNQGYDGFWRVGGDNLNGWPDVPATFWFAGSVDEIAVYPSPLTAAQVAEHYTASGRTGPDLTEPETSITAPATGATVDAGTVTVTASAADNVGVTAVDLVVDGSTVDTDTAAPYSFDWSAAVGPHTLRTVAHDAAGNTGQSAAVAVTVLGPDTTAPGAPGSLTASDVGPTSATLTWTAASDDRGVTGYRVVRDGSVVTTVSGLSHTVTGLTPSTAYSFTVRAVDAAGNVGPDSPAAAVTTGVADPVVHSDTWSGADGAPWSSAWTPSSTSGTVDTQGGTGRLAYDDVAGAFARAQLTGVPGKANSEVLLSYRWNSTAPIGYLNVYLRGSGGWQNAFRPRSGYGLQLQSNSGTVSVMKNVNGTPTTIRSVTGGQQVTTAKQWLRLRVAGSQIQFRRWTDGQVEPSAWTSVDTDTSVTGAGQLHVSLVRGGVNTGVKNVSLDDLVVREITP
ncbi:MAG TPA: LamG-like jellyroll fold domain-containing protein, partial [Mycobacteriales bacterium]|nr:LamG-like jellyroll fold domain-containing protein [Mycobacteriales bacterium]